MENQFGKYTLLKKLGDGGMAEVFLAEMKGPEGFSKYVAIKRILPHLSHDAVFTESFINEARLGGYLNHHNIVQTLDFGQINGFYYLGMEYVQGIDLRQLLQRCQDAGARMPLPLAIDIAHQICEGLVYAHTATDASRRPLKMIHRDLKPSNIMINSQGVVKIADFGVARAESNVAHTQLAQGNPKGTVAYMSPEQALGLLNIDQRADVFSLGAIFFELLTNDRIYTASTYLGALRQAQDGEIGPRLELISQLGRGDLLTPILKQALAADREDRYPNTKAFSKDLRRASMKVGASGSLGDFIERVLPDAFSRGSLHTPEVSRGKPEGTSLMTPRSPINTTPSGGSANHGRGPSGARASNPSQGAYNAPSLSAGQGQVRSEAPQWSTPQPSGADPSREAATIMRPAAIVTGPGIGPGRPSYEPHTEAGRSGPTLRPHGVQTSPGEAGPQPTPPRPQKQKSGIKQMMAALLSAALLISVGAFVALTIMGRRAQVTIVTEPAEANIRLPGGQEVDAPQSFMIPEGGLGITVSAPGYSPKEVKIPEDAPSGAEWRVRLTPLPSLLTVRVTPKEATLVVNGETAPGGSPYILRDLPLGQEIQVSVSAPGHSPKDQTLTLSPGDEKSLEIALEPKQVAPAPAPAPAPAAPSTAPAPKPAATQAPAPTAAKVATGYLACNAVPKGGGSMWAKVFLDGKYLGNTPMLKKPIPVGTHTIRFITEDNREKTQQIVVKAGKTSRVFMEFD